MTSIDAPRAPGMTISGPHADRVLVLAPTGDDAQLVSTILSDRGFDVFTVPDPATLARELELGAGLALIASEAFEDAASITLLQEVLEGQEPWSEMPLLIFGGSAEDAGWRATELLGTRAQIIILERPVGIAAFVSAAEGALRTRLRQYQVKRLLEKLEESAAAVARAHQEADRTKDEFLATLGHELRSPMTAVSGWIQLLKQDDLPREDAALALSMIESSNKVQAHIVEDLMDLSRIMAGKVMIERTLVELSPLVDSMVATFSATAILEGVELLAETRAGDLKAMVDPVRFQQIGWNLISNAIKFTPRGGTISVSLLREGDRAVLRVRDSGQGISPELLPRVFERYSQEESGRPHRGLGLGLAIVQHLVQSHGGTIEAFSKGRGAGAEFVVSLPLGD
jgi:signal transduction histidine kinase